MSKESKIIAINEPLNEVKTAVRWGGMGKPPHPGVHQYCPKDLGVNCRKCGRPATEHGIILQIENKHLVCPGDWVIEMTSGHYFKVSDGEMKTAFKGQLDKVLNPKPENATQDEEKH